MRICVQEMALLIRARVCVYACLFECMHVCMCMGACVCIYVYVCVYVRVCACICIRTRRHTQNY